MAFDEGYEMPSTALPSICLLRDMFLYDGETGNLISKSSTGSRWKAGRVVGGVNDLGYVTVSVGGKRLGAHRVVWAIYYGHWPLNDIDHIDGVRSNNRIDNLRDVSAETNLQNRRLPQRNNKSGLLGVSPNRKRFSASIKVDGVKHHLGTYDTPEEAHKVYLMCKRQFHRGCTI